LSFADSEASRQRWAAPRSVEIRVFNRNKAQFALATLTALVRGTYDFVIVGHVNLLTLASACLFTSRTGRARVILIAHGIEVWADLQRPLRRRAMASINLILCVSGYTKDRINAQLPELTNDRFAIFPNALSEMWTERFATIEHPERVIEHPERIGNLPQKFLLSVTRLDRGDRYKGIVSVIEALAMLSDTSIHYVVAGRGDDQEFLQRIAPRFGIQKRVHFVGAVTDAELANLYRKCSAFVLPSGKEGFGIVFLEAMFFGAPVIAAGEKGATDVVRDEETGLTVGYGDTVALARAIERMLTDTTLRARLREVGRATVIDRGRFTFHAYTERLAQIFGIPSPQPQVAASTSAGPAR
jgi:glycosyltransferase involved in cell wall biosynthesis